MKEVEMLHYNNVEIDQVKISRAAGAIFTELDGEAVILDMDSGIYYGLCEVGTSVWAHLETPVNFKKLIDFLLDEFEVEHDQCRNDVKELLSEMVQKELVKFETD